MERRCEQKGEEARMKLRWTVTGYNKKIPQKDGTYLIFDVTNISVFAETEQEALDTAKQIYKKKFYRIIQIDVPDHDHELEEKMKLLSLKAQTKIVKALGVP